MKTSKYLAVTLALAFGLLGVGGEERAPPSLFKKLNDEVAGDAVFINGKQLFIDDFIIEELNGTSRVLNQPRKHPKNPLIVPDQVWEKKGYYANGSVMYDADEKLFKIWYHVWRHQRPGDPERLCGYATSADGVEWTKPVI